MASTITELFGYNPHDQSPVAKQARKSQECAFLRQACTKTLSDGTISGMCTLKSTMSDWVICCDVRRYANNHQTLNDVAVQVLGAALDLVTATSVQVTGRCLRVKSERSNSVAN